MSSGDLNVLKQEILKSLDSRKIISAKAAQYLEIKDHINGSGTRSLRVIRKKKEVTISSAERMGIQKGIEILLEMRLISGIE